jgi:DNA-binding HxlR family transcriptional regulator
MRGHLRSLTQLGVLERRQQSNFPGSVDYELGPAGRDLLTVIRILQSWLASSPEGPLQPGSVAARSAIKALTEGWSSTIVRALAARPLSLTELNRLISNLNYPSLERRLGAMRLAGQIEPCASRERSTPYIATNWLRRAIAPLVAGASWERRYTSEEGAPFGRIDVEAIFLLAIPPLSLPTDSTGACRLAVETGSGNGDGRDLAGALVRVEEGQVVSCVSRLQGPAEAWTAGSTRAWLSALIEGDTDLLEIGGDCDLALALIDGLHEALFDARQRA